MNSHFHYSVFNFDIICYVHKKRIRFQSDSNLYNDRSKIIVLETTLESYVYGVISNLLLLVVIGLGSRVEIRMREIFGSIADIK